MTKYREVLTFIAHAFNPRNQVYDVQEFRRTISELLESVQEELNAELHGFSVRTIHEMNDFRERLPAQIERYLENCHFGIVDISDNNPNVLFELGHLSARGIPHVIVKARRSQDDYPVPADISNRLVCYYGEVEDLKQLLRVDILQGFREILKNQSLRSEFLNDIWFPPHVHYIHLISSPEFEKTDYADVRSANYMYLDNLGDKDALLETMTFLARSYPRSRTFKYSSDDFPARYIEDNLVIIGGPGELEGEGNRICRTMMQRYRSKVTYTEDCEVLVSEGKHFRAEYNRDGSIAKDYGYFARLPNPFNATSTIILINGIHTYGVLGAARAFSAHPSAQLNIRKIIEHFAYDGSSELAFECFFEVDVVASEVICPEIYESNLFRIQ